MKPLALSILALLAAASALAQSPAGGMLLVATPQLQDPRFAETVVLVLSHGRDGAIGVVVNRPTWVEPESLFPEEDFFRRYRGTVYFGGPVARTSALFLVRDGGLADGEPIIDDIHVTADVDEVRENLPSRTDERTLRIYAGYAGWGPGQLDSEIASGDWQVTPASGDLIFTPEPASLWREVHRVESDMGIVGLPGRPLQEPRAADTRHDLRGGLGRDLRWSGGFVRVSRPVFRTATAARCQHRQPRHQKPSSHFTSSRADRRSAGHGNPVRVQHRYAAVPTIFAR